LPAGNHSNKLAYNLLCYFRCGAGYTGPRCEWHDLDFFGAGDGFGIPQFVEGMLLTSNLLCKS